MAWSAGAVLTAAQLNTYLPQAWSNWTPALTASTNPAIGNGTTVGRYIQYGKTVVFTAKITFGSTSTYGSGAWSMSLPATKASGGVLRASCCYNDVSGGAFYIGQNYSSTTTTVAIGVDTGQAGGALSGVTSTLPFTWATTDTLEVFGTYEAA